MAKKASAPLSPRGHPYTTSAKSRNKGKKESSLEGSSPVKTKRKSAIVSELKTESHFLDGGMLDSQIESQAWFDLGCQGPTADFSTADETADVEETIKHVAESQKPDILSSPTLASDSHEDQTKSKDKKMTDEELFRKCIQGASLLYRKQEEQIRKLSSDLQDSSSQLEGLQAEICRLQDWAQRTKEQVALTLHLDDALASARAEIKIMVREQHVLREKEQAAYGELKIVQDELQEAKELISTVTEKLIGTSTSQRR